MIQTFDHFDLSEIAVSGQCFRIHPPKDNNWTVITGDHILKIKSLTIDDSGTGTYDFDCDPTEFDQIWVPYFDLETDYSAIISTIDPEDAYLNEAARYGSGLRILHQDLWEVIVSFIMSQRKSIPAIRSNVEKLCKNFGTEIEKGIFTFPSYEDLAEASAEDFMLCGLGYRANYLHMICRLISEGVWAPEEITSPDLKDAQIIDQLKQLPGIGLKVANCISLFGLHRLSAFPRDTWIQKIEDGYYGGRFPVEQYPEYAGVMQQYMFFFERKRKKARGS
ncbi:MAG: DNA-3-methyladenine glycosylase 2 family protein [Blautia sp.]|nr:DNA-3-methyladenine glycosylase 2 family protein [Lachnospiraceae bacterium]MBP3900985.1 DNA-3-methyladenine glycosylase 2 family protein [Blautia sp.]